VPSDADLARQDDIFTDGVDPASPTWAQRRVFADRRPVPDLTRLSTLAPAWIRVSPMEARSMQALA
jgi:hypothetical protein